MNPIFLLCPMLLPLLAGCILLLAPDWSRRARNRFSMISACLNSILIVLLLRFAVRDSVTIFRFLDDFSLTFRVDGMSILFAMMLAVMWPFALLYAFSYMEHSDPRGRFTAFYLMTYGITLGVALSANLTTLYVFFELLTLITVPVLPLLAPEITLTLSFFLMLAIREPQVRGR